MRRPRLAAAAIFVALAAAGIAIHALWPSPAVVWCDNGTDDDLVVLVDGVERTRVLPHEYLKLELAAGEHRLEARASGRAVDVEALEAHRGARWIWNVAGAQRYAVYTMTYGEDHDVAGPREVGAGQRLFAMPAEVGTDFMQPLPSTLLAPHGSKTATARGLYHYPLHDGRSCCHTK